MFAFEILNTISRRTGIPHFSQNNRPPNHTDLADARVLNVDGTCLRGPVRNFSVIEGAPGNPDKDYRFATPDFLIEGVSYFAVCQVRDTLDLVVSQYFSQGWLHTPNDDFSQVRKDLRAGRISVYDYALMEFEGRSDFGQESILQKMARLRVLEERLGPDRFLCVQYEEMVVDYDQWAARIEAFLQDAIPGIGSILSDLRPEYPPPEVDQEFFSDPLEYVAKNGSRLRHVRSPYPGDHRRFLTPAEIADLRSREQVLIST